MKSKIAKGKLAKASVFRGTKEKTSGGLTKTNLTKNKRGKIVSKKSHSAGQKAYKNISAWTKACQQARKKLGIKGFCPVGGKSAQGKAHSRIRSGIVSTGDLVVVRELTVCGHRATSSACANTVLSAALSSSQVSASSTSSDCMMRSDRTVLDYPVISLMAFLDGPRVIQDTCKLCLATVHFLDGPLVIQDTCELCLPTVHFPHRSCVVDICSHCAATSSPGLYGFATAFYEFKLNSTGWSNSPGFYEFNSNSSGCLCDDLFIDVTARTQVKAGISPGQQRLIYAGRQTEDLRALVNSSSFGTVLLVLLGLMTPARNILSCHVQDLLVLRQERDCS
jgi:hypothetical protein